MDKHKFIREYLKGLVPNLKVVSVGQVIGYSVNDDDFRQQFCWIDGAVALDFDQLFVVGQRFFKIMLFNNSLH